MNHGNQANERTNNELWINICDDNIFKHSDDDENVV